MGINKLCSRAASWAPQPMGCLLHSSVLCLCTLYFVFSSAGSTNSITGQKLCVCLCVWLLTRVAQIITDTCNLTGTDILMNSDHKPKTRSVWPSLGRTFLFCSAAVWALQPADCLLYNQWRHWGGGEQPRVTSSRGDTRIEIKFVVEFRKTTSEGGRCEETTAKKVIPLQRAMTKKGRQFFRKK